jgi:two-component system, cell cycle response regulator
MKVLVADDEIVSRRLIESSIRRWGYEILVAKDGIEALQILLDSDPPHMAVLDWLMPGMDGVELCRRVRARKDETYTYILLLSSKKSSDDVVAGLEAGADDYITKPFEPQELKVRLRTGKRILCLLDQLTSARETLRDLAARDPLTGLWNHNSIIDLLEKELARADRQGTSNGIVLADLDHFKQINDTYGHLAGDRVLCAAAEALRTSVRPYDLVGRFGGEEFIIVLSGCDELNAVSHCERLRHAIGNLTVDAPGREVHVTASFGVTVVGPDSRMNAQTALHVADSAMYRAKRGGRNRVEFLAATSECTAAVI